MRYLFLSGNLHNEFPDSDIVKGAEMWEKEKELPLDSKALSYTCIPTAE
jgi:hypothetical protein